MQDANMSNDVDLRISCLVMRSKTLGSKTEHNFKKIELIILSDILFRILIRSLQGHCSARPLHYILLLSLFFLLFIPPSAASTLSLSAPKDIDVSGPGTYGVSYNCSENASSLSASIMIPDGFAYSRGARVCLGTCNLPFEPSINGQSMMWDLSAALRSCRSIVINEFELNPAGADRKKEWIELYNPTHHALNLGGWKLVDSYSGKAVSISEGTVILPGDYKVVVWTAGSLVNSHLTRITLFDSKGREVDSTSDAKDNKNDNQCWARYPNRGY
jgi:hypothetical protein